ncbi:MAG: hypothetical protein N3E45_09710 [Oscillatoriaceae bacterium SKW80]|nr:hypothetical protein [Oscillatoriaceae bacterium SKYG93]MCX8121091.1 hypothetical protein [Oscillatoriaceae bacterium SKW80]MDW8453579.1 hypothetical protein [Oscillatoriaceae cyanobacterium SKYGB_i_bin93]HIK26930.1 hypothetical protein [Oscillatoriaceae cyanobacterium M7585_C2015_266]
MLKKFLVVILTILLTACTEIGPGPNNQLVKQALALQLSQTQAQLEKQLHLSQPPELEIEKITIKKREPIQIEDLQGFRINGTYDIKVKLSNKEIRQSRKPFEVYLQRQEQAKTWRLARLLKNKNGEETWATYLLPPAGY